MPLEAEHVPAGSDPYPSRVGDAERVLPRRDPVVHARDGSATGPLTGEQLQDFDRRGFLVLESFFDRERVAQLRQAAASLADSRRGDASPEVIHEPERKEVRSVFRVHETAPAFASLSRDRSLVGAVQQILGGGVYIHQSRINLKPGFQGKEFYWHSDFETWHVEDGMPRMHAVSCSINLDQNHPFNGPLMVMPGSHRHYVSCAGRTPENHHLSSLRRQEYGVPSQETLQWLGDQGGIVQSTGGPGTVTLFDCNIMHGSSANMTPYPRSNVFFVYNSVENALVAPFCGLAPRPDHIANRNFAAVEAEQHAA